MQRVFIGVEHEKFAVEFEEKNGWYDGNVYPIDEWNKATGETGWSYQSKSSGGDMHDTLNDDCRIMFAFLFVWRGVWEGRIYFKDDEYWSEELRTMADVWDKLQPILKDKIRQANPEYTYDD